MLVWLDGRTNTKAQPQENFGREIMELFTIGVGNYTEADVYAAARVFTGWNLTRPGAAADGSQHYEFVYNANQHDIDRQDVQLPDLSRRRQDDSGARRGGGHAGRHRLHQRRWRRIPNTARYLASKLYRFFVTEFGAVNVTFVNRRRLGLSAERRRHEGGDARSAARRPSSGTAAPTSRATRGRWSSSSARSRTSAGAASRSTTR